MELVGPVLLHDESPVDVVREDPLAHHPEPTYSKYIIPVWNKFENLRVGGLDELPWDGSDLARSSLRRFHDSQLTSRTG